MDDEFDAAPPADDIPPGPPAIDAPAECDIDPVAAEAIGDAVSFLRDKLGDDPEAQEVADRLEDVSVAHEPDLEGEVSDEEIKALPESIRTSVRSLRTRHALLLKQHERLSTSTATLLERFKQQRKQPVNESAQLTRQIARYNADTLELAHNLTEAKMPDLYADNKVKLEACKTLVQFEDLVEAALKAAPAPLREGRKPLREGRKPLAPAPAAATPAPVATTPAPAPAAPKPSLKWSVWSATVADNLKETETTTTALTTCKTT